MGQRKDISMKERIKNRVHELYWNDDINCARTAIICLGELFQTGRHEETSQRNGRMGKAKNQGGLLETMEESQDKVPNAESIRVRTLESERTCLQQKRPLAYGASLKPNLFK